MSVLASTCRSIATDRPNAEQCGEPAAYVDNGGRGWCLRHGPDLIRHFGSGGFEPLTPVASEFLAAFAVNGYGPVGHVWPDAPDDDATG
jgi:hypothetical protein